MSNTRGLRTPNNGDISIPDHWLNLAIQIPWAFPLPQNADGETETKESLARIYSEECARIEMLEDEYRSQSFISVPGAVLDEYAKYRPSRFQRAAGLEIRPEATSRIPQSPRLTMLTIKAFVDW